MDLQALGMVATPSRAARQQCAGLFEEYAKGRMKPAELERRLLEADPWNALGLYTSALDAWSENDLKTARELMWRCLLVMPQDFRTLFAMFLLTVDEDRQWGGELLVLAMRRLADGAPEEDVVAALMARAPQESLVRRLVEDPKELERMLQETAEERGGKVEALIPFWAADQLSDFVGDEEDEALVARILARPQEYAGVLTGLCAGSGGGFNPGPGDWTVSASLAVMGETGRMEFVPAIAARIRDESEEVGLTAAWAMSRIAAQRGAEFMAELRNGVEGRSEWQLGAMAQQLWINRRKPGVEQMMVKLLDRRDGDSLEEYGASFLLLADGLLKLHRGRNMPLVKRAMQANRAAFGDELRTIVKGILSGENQCQPRWDDDELRGLTLDQILVDEAIAHLADEGHEDDDEDWMDDEEDEDEDEAPFVAPVRPGRNEPCWCGSGKKYKKCHLAQDEAEEAEPASLLQRLLEFTVENLPQSEMNRELARFGGALDPESDGPPDFLLQWLAFDRYSKKLGDTAAGAFLKRYPHPDDEREVLKGWVESCAAIYEVQEVRPEEGLDLFDVLRETRVFVHDKSTSRTAARYEYLLARVELFDGEWGFIGDLITIPRPCAPQVLARVRSERREGESWAAMLKRAAPEIWRWIWEESGRGMAGMQLATSTGEKLEICTGVYELLDEERVKAALRESKEMVEDGGSFTWVEPDGNLILGWLKIANERMRVETMSRERHERGAALLRELLPADSLIHVKDEFGELSRERHAPARRVSGPSTEEGNAIVLEYLEKHYSTWPDTALPALDGRTPREAAKTAEGRKDLEQLLRDMENRSDRERLEGRPAYDFSKVRRELGMG